MGVTAVSLPCDSRRMTNHDAPCCSAADLPPFLSTNRLAALLEIHPATPRQWRHQGRGPAYVKIGGVVRYPRESVLAFLAAGTKLGAAVTDATVQPIGRSR